MEKSKAIFQRWKLGIGILRNYSSRTLKRLDTKWVPGAHACLAAYCGEVRLIDNIQLVPFEEK